MRGILFATLSALTAAPVGFGGTIACPDPENGILTVQDALDAAQNGDEIVIAAGEYRGNFTLADVQKVKLRGAGKVVLDARPQGATGSGPALVVTSCPELRIEGITLRHAAGADAAGAGLRIIASSSVVLDGVAVLGCETYGILAEDCTLLTLRDCLVRGNAGGISIAGSLAELDGVQVENDGQRGILIFGDDARIERCRVALIRGGGGIDISGQRPVVRKCEVTAVLDADTNGITTSGANPDLRGNRVSHCDTGIYVVYGAEGVVMDNAIEGCSGSGLRLGSVSHDLTLERNSVVGCGSPLAAGFLVDGAAQILVDNRAERCGGDGFTVLSAGCVLRGNKALDNLRDGFDIDAQASDTLLEQNVAKANAGEGIENSGSATRLAGNQAKKNRIDFAADAITVDEGGNGFDVATPPTPQID